MKNVPIKFRGKSPEKGGKYIYGWFVMGINYHGEDTPYIVDNLGVKHIVDIDTVCQLAGYDNAGNEVYEGDKVDCYHGFLFSASELVKKEIRCVSKVKLIAMVESVDENLNSPFDYQFLLKSKVKKNDSSRLRDNFQKG